LLEKNADLAAEQASEILNVHPGHPTARLLLGAAHRRAGRLQSALDVLENLTAEFPHSAPAHLELGVACFEYGRGAEAEAALRRAVQLNPASADGWRLLADCLDPRPPVEGRGRGVGGKQLTGC
jgi:predicted Zn-dependent protease